MKQDENSLRRYLAGFAGTLLAIAVIVFTVNWYVDPFGYWGRFPLGVYSDSWDREIKATLVRKRPHEVTLLGTSKTHQIDPDHIERCTIFNASMNGMRAEQALYFVQRFVPANTFLLLGLDFFIFREDKRRTVSFGTRSLQNVISYTLSTGAVLRTLNTIKQVRRERLIAIKRNGARYTEHMVRADKKMTDYNYDKYLVFARAHMFNDFSLSDERFEMLRELKIFLEGRDQSFAVFINPVSEGLLDFYREMGLWGQFLEFRRRTNEIFPNVYDFSISGYSAKEKFYKHDPLHYLPRTGSSFINEILEDHGCNPATPE